MHTYAAVTSSAFLGFGVWSIGVSALGVYAGGPLNQDPLLDFPKGFLSMGAPPVSEAGLEAIRFCGSMVRRFTEGGWRSLKPLRRYTLTCKA